MVGFNQSHSEPLGDIERFVQEKPGNYRSEKPVSSSGINKYHLKCDCINGSFVNGIRERVWYNFALENLQAFKYTENYEPHFLSKVLKLFFSPITFYLEGWSQAGWFYWRKIIGKILWKLCQLRIKR